MQSLRIKAHALHQVRNRKHDQQEVLRRVRQPTFPTLSEVRGRKRALICVLRGLWRFTCFSRACDPVARRKLGEVARRQ